jgi:protein-tyrosine phosphatase
VVDTSIPKVLCVCTSNLCGSVGMQLFLARSWGSDAEVSSAGTYAMIGWAIPELAQRIMASQGLDFREHEPTQLTAAPVEEADLVLVAANEQRVWIGQHLAMVPSKVFLLTEAAALAKVATLPESSNRSERIRLAAAALDAARPQLTGVRHASLLDPNELNYEEHLKALQQCKENLDVLTAWID